MTHIHGCHGHQTLSRHPPSIMINHLVDDRQGHQVDSHQSQVDLDRRKFWGRKKIQIGTYFSKMLSLQNRPMRSSNAWIEQVSGALWMISIT